MLDWLANLLLSAGAGVADLFVSQDEPGFAVIQMMIATLVLAAVVTAVVYWQSLVRYWEARWRSRK
jgi:Tfp pilus assembly protein PilV